MSKQVHLFNCDRTYKLDAIEGLLNATKAKLDFVPVVEKRYFSLAQMHEIATKTIPELKIDVAFFVVHAHESRLSINEDNAGIGYANIYRALLRATGGKVIVIIGGDDNYKNEDEEDRVVISRWAKRKILSQFSDDFLDGSKSFIFSWNMKHREIHEEALLHYFDLSKKGQKFEYQPKPRRPKSVQTAQTRIERTLSGTDHSTCEQRGREGAGSRNSSNAAQKRHSFASRPCYSADQTSEQSLSDHSKDAKAGEVRRDHRGDDNLFSHRSSTEQSLSVTDPISNVQQREGSISSDSRNANQRRDGASPSNLGYDTSRVDKAPVHHEQRALPTKTEDLVILCCNVSDDSLHAVMQVLQVITPKLNLSVDPPVENLSPDKIKGYLNQVRLKACVLVVDGKTVDDAYKNLPQQREEYQRLLETAADRVAEKVIILICDDCSLPSKDEEIVSRTIEDVITRRGKGYIAWLKKGKLTVEPDVLVKCLTSTSPTPQPDPQTNFLRASQEKNRDAPGSVAEMFSNNSGQSQSAPLQRNPSDWGHMQQAPTTIQPLVNTYPATLVTGEPVWLRSILRSGRISYELRDLQLWNPALIVPDLINTDLMQLYQHTPEIGVKIVLGIDGLLHWCVDPKLIEVSKSRYEGIKVAANETLMLKTRIRQGLVSFQENDVDFRYGIFQIPQEVIIKLKEEHWATPCGVLYVISDEKGNLRIMVKIGKIDRLLTFVKKSTEGF